MVNKTITDQPTRADLATGEIHCERRTVYRVNVVFKGSKIRRG